MRIKNKQLLIAAALGLALSSSASAFGLPGVGVLTGKSEASSAGGDVGGEVSSFITKSNVMNKTVAMALYQLNAAFADKEKQAVLATDAHSLAVATDPKEIDAKAGESIKTQAAEAEKNLKAADAKERIEKLSPEVKKAVGRALLALGISALQAPDLAKTGQSLVQKVGMNPIDIPKVVPVKDALPVLANIGASLPTIVQAGFKLMREVNVNPGTPTKDAVAVAEPNLVL